MSDSTSPPVFEKPPQEVFDNPDTVLTIEPEPWERTLPGRSRRTGRQRETDYVQIAGLLQNRLGPTEIANELNKTRNYRLSRQQVIHDIKEVRQRLKLKHLKAAATAKAEELEFLERLEVEALRVWGESGGDRKTQRHEAVLDRQGKPTGETRTVVTIEKRLPDPAYLNVALKVAELRIKVLGLEAPTKIEAEMSGNVEHNHNVDQMRVAYRARIMAQARLEAQTARPLPQVDAPPPAE